MKHFFKERFGGGGGGVVATNLEAGKFENFPKPVERKRIMPNGQEKYLENLGGIREFPDICFGCGLLVQYAGPRSAIGRAPDS